MIRALIPLALSLAAIGIFVGAPYISDAINRWRRISDDSLRRVADTAAEREF